MATKENIKAQGILFSLPISTSNETKVGGARDEVGEVELSDRAEGRG